MLKYMGRMQARSVNSSNANNEFIVHNGGNINNNNANNGNRFAPTAFENGIPLADHRKVENQNIEMQGVCTPSERKTIAG
mgnify:CR=1 FL=1